MKKMIQLILVLGIFLVQMQVSWAADKVWADETYDLSTIKRVYFLSDMSYSPTKKSPAKEEILDMTYQQGLAANIMVLPKADLERFLLRDVKVDLNSTEPKEFEKTAAQYLGNYVDAYVKTTIVHNQRIVIFYDVYEVKSGKWVFSYQNKAGADDEDNIKTYEKLTKDFYKTLKKEVGKQIKKSNTK